MKIINDLIASDPNIDPAFKAMFETKDDFKSVNRLDEIKEVAEHDNIKQLIERLDLNGEQVQEIHERVLEDFQYYVEHPTKWQSDYNSDFDKYYKWLKTYIIEEYA